MFRHVKDPRRGTMLTHSCEVLLWQALCLFQTHTESRRQFEKERDTEAFRVNLGKLSGTAIAYSAHTDTMNYLLERLSPDELHKIIRCNAQHLIRSKTLDDIRFDKHFLIAVDGVCFSTFKRPHCEHCLRRTTDGITSYFHYALVAMIVSPEGLVLPIEIEFIENTPEKGKTFSERDNEFKKQDCELKAFYRLAEQLKKNFPHLGITMLLDGLYANQNVIDICEKNHWDYFISLQDDSLPAFQREIAEITKTHPDMMLQCTDGNFRQTFRWTTPIRHAFKRNWGKVVTSRSLFAIEEIEENRKTRKKSRFMYISSRRPERNNIVEFIHEGARQRWKIENQTFNTLKNHGMELQHVYGEKGNCLKNYFLFRLIALSIEQFLTFSNGLIKILSPDTILPSREKGISLFGSLKQLAKRLLESLRNDITEPIDLSCIRFCIPTG